MIEFRLRSFVSNHSYGHDRLASGFLHSPSLYFLMVVDHQALVSQDANEFLVVPALDDGQRRYFAFREQGSASRRGASISM